MAVVRYPTIYIDCKPYFLGTLPIATKLSPLGWHIQGGGVIYIIKNLQGRRWARGLRPPWLRAPWPPPISLRKAPLHHPHNSLFANMMFHVIYYFPVIYCVAMSSFKWLVVHDNGDIVRPMVAYMFVIFYNGLMYLCMSAHTCWGIP
jgi:hypothetical protein